MKRALAFSLLAAFLATAPAANARPIHTVAQASDVGQYFASASLDHTVRRPKRLRAIVATDGAPVDVTYSVVCSRGLRSAHRSGGYLTTGGARELPVLMRRPRSCDVYLDASYEDFDSEATVAISVRLQAKQRRKR